MDFLLAFDLIGCGVFAVSGAIIAYQQKMDGIGVVVLATVTAIGGGTLRDLLLGIPVFWLNQPSYIYVVVFTCLIAILWINKTNRLPDKSLEFADAVGLSLFVVMGTEKALGYGVAPITAVIMGMMTGCFGGVLRDVMANQIPLIFQKHLYAVCCLAGGSVYVTLDGYVEPSTAAVAAFFTVLLLRIAAIKKGWSIHVFNYDK
jgi:uncharacterized membrane protein YeiH